jgi:hypothetical protein
MVPQPGFRSAQSRRVVLLRKNLDDPSLTADAARAAVTTLAAGLEPGELLAVHTRADLTLTRPWEALVAPDLGALVCDFGPDDHELFLWRTPPEPPETAGAVVDGLPTVDVRALEPPLALLIVVDAVARLQPGEVLIHVDDRPPLLIADLLAGRAAFSGPRWTDDGVRTRVVRLPSPAAGEQPAAASRTGRLSPGVAA